MKVFNRLGRKQSKLQIFPLFHTYPFKAENPPPLQLLQHPRGTSGFSSFLLQPLKGSPGLSMAQGVTGRALQGPGHREGGQAVPALQNQPLLLKHLLVQKPPACPVLHSPWRGLKVLQVLWLLWGERVVPDWKECEQRAQVPINAHKVHECRDVSSLPLRLAQPGTGRGCAVLHPQTRDQPNPGQEPAGPPCHPHVPGQDPPVAGPVLLSL